MRQRYQKDAVRIVVDLAYCVLSCRVQVGVFYTKKPNNRRKLCKSLVFARLGVSPTEIVLAFLYKKINY